jgi:transketolase
MIQQMESLKTESADFVAMPHKIDPFVVRRSVLKMLHRAKASHLGSNMSVIEMLIAMYGCVDCDKIRELAPDRSRILISKGHCAAATYATLAHFGILPRSLLDTYHLDGSLLTGHVNHSVHGVEHSTGGLGHGINVAVGCALGLRSRGYPERLVFAMLGDGELQEGSIWEAMMFVSHMNLCNLITLVDNNAISSITYTEKVIDMRPLTARFEGFGLSSHVVDGHDVNAIMQAINSIKQGDKPGVIICNTVKGRDVPFAESQPIWHYKSITDEEYSEAISHLDRLEGMA